MSGLVLPLVEELELEETLDFFFFFIKINYFSALVQNYFNIDKHVFYMRTL